MAYLGNNPRTKLWNVDTTEEVDAKIANAVAGFDALPTQSGQTGKYLSTDGADASWETITQYTPPTDQGSGNFLAGDGTYKAIDVSTDIATAVAALVDSAPSTLDTLNELAASLGDDANFATSVSTSLGTKVDKTTTVNGHALSGNVTVTKSDVSLGNVDNTSDANKPVSTAQATALDLKADNTTVSSHTSNTSNPHSVTKAQVGLGSVDNTADSAKPVSTAQQTALNLKANLTNADFSGNTSAMMAMTADNIPVGTSTTIPSGKQLVVDHLDVLGTLDVQGTLATVTGGYLSQTTMKTQSIAHTNGTNAINIDSVGNIGIGVTPSAWNSNRRAIHIKGDSAGGGSINSDGLDINIAQNATISSGIYRYIADGRATWAGQYNGGYTWYTAPSGTAGNPITWNTTMTIDSAGRVTMPYQPSFNVYNGTASLGQDIVFANVRHNIGNNWNTSTNTFTAPVAGSYLFTFAFLHSNTTAYCRVLFKINGYADTRYGDTLQNTAGTFNASSASVIIRLNGGDTVKLFNEQAAIYGAEYGAFSGQLLS